MVYTKKRLLWKFVVLFVTMLIVNLPITSALNISDTSSSSVTDSSVVVSWQTDEEADSSVFYGTSVDSVTGEVSSTDATDSHAVEITGLEDGTEYFFSVASSTASENAIDDNEGAFYSFTTQEAQEADETGSESSESSTEDTSSSSTTPPPSSEVDETAAIDLKINDAPTVVPDSKVNIGGLAAHGSEIRVSVNGGYFAKVEAGALGKWQFTDIPLTANALNELLFEASLASQTQSVVVQVRSDTSHPELIVTDVSGVDISSGDVQVLTGENTVTISGSLSEQGEVEFLVTGPEGEQKVESKELTGPLSFAQKVNLEEGKNSVEVKGIDLAGLTDSVSFSVISDTLEPTVDAEFSKGQEFYQNRAETDITGQTEPGATVFLYVYRPLSYDQELGFGSQDIWDVAKAGEKGNFQFEDVDFENEPVLSFLDSDSFKASLLDLAPKEVPNGLQKETIKGISSAQAADAFTYYVYILSIDQSGKVGYFKDQVTVNTCYSQHLDFLIKDEAKFQAPLKLDPQLLDDGREQISAVFTFDYQGNGHEGADVSGAGSSRGAYQINSVRFEKACTQSMLEDDKFGMGCGILPNEPKVASNVDSSSHYLTWDLFSTEDYRDRDYNVFEEDSNGKKEINEELAKDAWNDLKDRRLVFPLQVTLNYQEYDASGNLGSSKTQTSCYDISYLVDVPVQTEEFIPDGLANALINSTTWTIEKIDKVIPYLEKAILVTGVGCVASFLSKIVVRIMRLTVSKTEATAGKARAAAGEENTCPGGDEQYDYYLQSTIDSWSDIDGRNDAQLPENYDERVLEEVCPATASMWKLEASLEKAYRWTCDRVFCHASPARWTETKEEEEIKNVILEQQQCSASGACIPLEEVENCREYVKESKQGLYLSDDLEGLDISGNTCYLTAQGYQQIDSSIGGRLYRNAELVSGDRGIYELEAIQSSLNAIGTGVSSDKLLVIESGKDGFCAARAESCDTICNAKPGYGPVTDGTDPADDGIKTAACYKQGSDGKLEGIEDARVDGQKYPAGYTSDCFIGDDLEMYQCVCQPDAANDGAAVFTGAREAVEKNDDGAELYSYRQDKVFTESSGRRGTHYSEIRYYAGRDFSAAFGQNYALDVFSGEDKKVTEINPNTQHIGAFQTMCLSGIRARLVLVRNILDGLRRCVVEATDTGFQDAGMCKQIFAQHMCGMIYKAITYFTNQCSPYSFNDVGREGAVFGGVVQDFSSSIEPAIQSSIDELQGDYGNAALNQYFAGGAQGFAQSLCLAAFGYDWPLGFDFIQDAAYSVAMKTSALIVPASREFSNYDPKTLTATYNYNVAGVIFAGCKIQSYQTYLKCVGPEDLGHPGIDSACGGEGCDCLNLQKQSAFESEKTYYLEDGQSVVNANSGEMIDIQMQMPQKVQGSHYRYDHVVIDVQIDPNEDASRCFEEGIATANGGRFYQPIKDNSPTAVASCQVQLDGTFSCPELSGLFYGEDGLAYLQAPYVQCYNDRAGIWESCSTPNLFLEGDEIAVRPTIYTDGAGYCLQVEVSGSGTNYGKQILNIPAGATGQIQPSISLGEVNAEMFGVFENGMGLVASESNEGCGELTITDTPSSISSNYELEFSYDIVDSKYVVTVPSGVEVIRGAAGPSGNSGGQLKIGSETSLSLDAINKVVFGFKGFEFSNALGNVGSVGSPEQCVYKVQRASQSSSRDEAAIGIDFSLLHKDSQDGCYSANQLVTKTGLGEISVDEDILVQRNEIAAVGGGTSSIYDYFIAKDYSSVIREASGIIEANEGELNEAVGVYFYLAALIMQSPDGNIGVETKSRIQTMLDRFFLRLDSNSNVIQYTFDDETIEHSEFQKVRAYACQIANHVGILSRYAQGSVDGEYHCDASTV